MRRLQLFSIYSVGMYLFRPLVITYALTVDFHGRSIRTYARVSCMYIYI
jgi:hypothetical protein